MFAPAFSRRSLLLLFLPCLLALAGCQAPQSFPTPGADWQTLTGQAHYSSGTGRSIIGDVVIRRSGRDNFQLGFSSGPGFPLLKLWQNGDAARAEGALARGSWQGSSSKPPKPLQGWVLVREAFATVPKNGGAYGAGGWKALAEVKGGSVAHLEMTVPATGERFVFHFTP